MILHTLNASPGSTAFRDCLATAGAADTILLLGDGVYAALPGSEAEQALLACPARLRVLEIDARAAGLLQRLADSILIDMDGFVALSETHPRQLAWY